MRAGFWLGLAAAATMTVAVHAQAPDGATGMCKDGTYTQASTRKDACKGHSGVKTWYPTSGGAQNAPAGGTLNPAPASETAPPAGTTQKTHRSKVDQTPSAPVNGGSSRVQAPGGGPGLVWVDSKKNMYYCAADPNYGRTKSGKYLSEADAQAAGATIAKNQNCAVQ